MHEPIGPTNGSIATMPEIVCTNGYQLMNLHSNNARNNMHANKNFIRPRMDKITTAVRKTSSSRHHEAFLKPMEHLITMV